MENRKESFAVRMGVCARAEVVAQRLALQVFSCSLNQASAALTNTSKEPEQ